MKKRESGILLNISSLPSKYGIGSLGIETKNFVDFLYESECSIWQILPLNVTSYGDSPYQSPSNYGLNYYYIDLEYLFNKKLLTEKELNSALVNKDESRINYSNLFNKRIPLLKKAFSRFDKESLDFLTFLKEGKNYHDFALFMTLKELNNLKPWYEWDDKYKKYSLDIENEVIKNNKDLFEFYMWTQYEFINEFFLLKQYANSKNIKIMGDLPIYVALDSVEVWKYPSLFELDENRMPKRVAGCPPDCFSVDGQLWGNPLYNWNYQKATNYKWWNERISNSLKFFDYLRIDHFRGFSGYYAIPFKDKTARNGKWVKGPGFDLFKDKLDYPIIAEDLGMMDEAFYKFFDACGYPGMKIVTQAFDDDNVDNTWRPSNYTYNFFSYTSTHDSKTTLQFIEELSNEQRITFIKVLKDECQKFNIPFIENLSNENLVYKICELNFANKAKAAIIPMQDLLLKGKEGRMNLPSTISSNNWSRKINKEEFDNKKSLISSYLERWNDNYERNNN